ncbi:hypothetical protein ATANTOWER_001982 [Ataeniobius toweri]|uniref:Uncharacterized protein n=1 Tax=Ataeniobius toweri TaxID=208326 RepID=A0ABU7A9L4_9TELE|nr:hypothetical protein [Ataeniobius toweri]
MIPKHSVHLQDTVKDIVLGKCHNNQGMELQGDPDTTSFYHEHDKILLCQRSEKIAVKWEIERQGQESRLADKDLDHLLGKTYFPI